MGARSRRDASPDAVARLIADGRSGNAGAIARLISMAEDGDGAVSLARALVDQPARADAAFVVGITGAPGVGKSTLTSALIAAYRARNQRVAVLAVDPSSSFSGGALLGDRLRMREHAFDPAVYIRSMANRGALGGLSKATPQALEVLDTLGFDLVMLETVGVGQAEIDILGAAQVVVVVTAPGLGDEVQAAKAGVLEIADIFVVNKADQPGANRLTRELSSTASLPRTRGDTRQVAVVQTRAADGDVGALVAALDAVRTRQCADPDGGDRSAARTHAALRNVVLDALDAWLATAAGAALAAELMCDVRAGRRSGTDVAVAIGSALASGRCSSRTS